MTHTDLPSPGTVRAHELRMLAAKAISSYQVSQSEGTRAQLETFFSACLAAVQPAKKAKK